MATAHLVGDAEIEYEPPGESAIVHLLAAPLLVSPLWGFQINRGRVRYEAWNADGTAREVFTIGSAVDEIIGLVRFENDPVGLRELIQYALEDDVTLTYRPLISDEYPCKLVGIAGSSQQVLTPDRDRYGFGEWEVALHLRRVDGGTFDGLL